jgi:hypothetical protein
MLDNVFSYVRILEDGYNLESLWYTVIEPFRLNMLYLCVWFDVLSNSLYFYMNLMWSVILLASVRENLTMNFPWSQCEAYKIIKFNSAELLLDKKHIKILHVLTE